MITVKATREGLTSHMTASGWLIDDHIPFVALPSTKALHKFVRIINPLNNARVIAVVLDVGPWNIHDDGYVFFGTRPGAESGVNSYGNVTNGSGIDLGELVWKQLGMVDNSEVSWEFVEP